MLVFAVLVAGAAGAASSRGHAHARTVVYRISGTAWDLGTSAGCPDGSLRYSILSVGGRSIGTSTLCVGEAQKRDAGGRVTVVEKVVQTDAFADGWLRTRSTQISTTSADGAKATIRIHGVVAGGTGRYRGVRGTIVGAGGRRGDAVEIRVTVRLR